MPYHRLSIAFLYEMYRHLTTMHGTYHKQSLTSSFSHFSSFLQIKIAICKKDSLQICRYFSFSQPFPTQRTWRTGSNGNPLQVPIAILDTLVGPSFLHSTNLSSQLVICRIHRLVPWSMCVVCALCFFSLSSHCSNSCLVTGRATVCPQLPRTQDKVVEDLVLT